MCLNYIWKFFYEEEQLGHSGEPVGNNMNCTYEGKKVHWETQYALEKSKEQFQKPLKCFDAVL